MEGPRVLRNGLPGGHSPRSRACNGQRHPHSRDTLGTGQRTGRLHGEATEPHGLEARQPRGRGGSQDLALASHSPMGSVPRAKHYNTRLAAGRARPAHLCGPAASAQSPWSAGSRCTPGCLLSQTRSTGQIGRGEGSFPQPRNSPLPPALTTVLTPLPLDTQKQPHTGTPRM